MGGGDRDAPHAGQQQAEGRGDVRGEALVLFQLHHVHAHGLDDLLAAHAGAEGHHHAAQQHQPDGDLHAVDAALAVGEGSSSLSKMFPSLTSSHINLANPGIESPNCNGVVFVRIL